MALASTLGNAEYVFADRGRNEQAESAQRRASEVYDKLAADFPDHPFNRFEQGHGHWVFGDLMLRFGRLAEAETSFRRSRGLYAKLSAEFPQDAGYRNRMLRGNLSLADVLQREGKLQGEPDVLPKTPGLAAG